jgi:hypothetical protein
MRSRILLPFALLAMSAGVRAQTPSLDRIVGTWVVHVPDPTEPFDSLQTFSADGTFTENSSLLAQLIEGPGHGVWRSTGGGTYLCTFQLFTFGDDRTANGRIRIRAQIALDDNDHFTARFVVDFMQSDGTVMNSVGSGSFTGTRMAVVSPNDSGAPAEVTKPTSGTGGWSRRAPRR